MKLQAFEHGQTLGKVLNSVCDSIPSAGSWSPHLGSEPESFPTLQTAESGSCDWLDLALKRLMSTFIKRLKCLSACLRGGDFGAPSLDSDNREGKG